MNKMKTYALSAAAFGGLFLIGSLMHSRDSQAKGATYATPVTVTNTTANAVGVRDEDAAGRNAFQISVVLTSSGTAFMPLSIPSGKRLVIDYVSYRGDSSSGTQALLFLFSNQGSGPQVAYSLMPVQS